VYLHISILSEVNLVLGAGKHTVYVVV
jgi:hypothetical protein